MPSFQDSIFLFVLALLLFGPKRLPVLARELGKWVGEFRRASNEFKMQMEEEMRSAEQADRQKQIAAMEAAAPVAPPIPEPEHPHMPAAAVEAVSDTSDGPVLQGEFVSPAAAPAAEAAPAVTYEVIDGVRTPVLPIAVSGELSIMPPSTGLPTPRSNGNHSASNKSSSDSSNSSSISSLIDSIPQTEDPAAEEHAHTASETGVHGH
jgi:sec-independent protein translocase protein TatB